MEEVLTTALELTVLGMGMTFLSLGALVLGMYLLTALFKGKEPATMDEAGPSESEPERTRLYPSAAPESGTLAELEEAQRRTAAATVAVALALAEADASHSDKPVCRETHEAWNDFARGLHLSRRLRYESRKPQQ